MFKWHISFFLLKRFDLVLTRFNEVFASRNCRKYKTFTIGPSAACAGRQLAVIERIGLGPVQNLNPVHLEPDVRQL